MNPEIELVAHCNNFSGWGLDTYMISKALESEGIPFVLNPFAWDFRDYTTFGKATSSDSIKSFLETKLEPNYRGNARRLVCVSPIGHRMEEMVKEAIMYTVWESSCLPKKSAQRMNETKAIITCSEWNIHTFSASGVDVPLFRVSRGVDAGIFKYTKPNLEGDIIFTCGGRKEGGGFRKNLDQIVKVFTKFNQKYPHTQLKIKSFPDEGVPCNHPKISVIDKFLTFEEMADFYSSGHAFISTSSSEGWGLMPFESMSCGRPAIMARFSGVQEYFDNYVGYCVDFHYDRASGVYAQVAPYSIWAHIDEDSFFYQMERVLTNQSEYLDKCEKSRERMQRFSVEAFNKNFCKAVRSAMK